MRLTFSGASCRGWRMVGPRARSSGLAAILVAGLAMGVEAHGVWILELIIDPLPSPYLSDWELDPSIVQVILTNETSQTTDVTLRYTIARDGATVMSGVTDPETIMAGETRTFDGTGGVTGDASWDSDIEDLLIRSGRLPEGEYEACVTATDPGGTVLDQQCAPFSILYPDPPFLIFPMDGERVEVQDLYFEWFPIQGPVNVELGTHYVLEIAEVDVAGGQVPLAALDANILHHVEPDLRTTNVQYPIAARAFVPGRTYAWRVQALDDQNLPVSSNQGRSEIWTFTYEPAGSTGSGAVAFVDVSPDRDSLAFVGDTVRFEAAVFDESQVEVFDRQVTWTSSDTSVAKVDSLGVVTATGVGNTHIVASVDGVVDTAFALAAESQFMVGFTPYDPETETPPLLQVIENGSFTEMTQELMRQFRSGGLRIPVPRTGGIAVSPETNSCVLGAYEPGTVTVSDSMFVVRLDLGYNTVASLLSCFDLQTWLPDRIDQVVQAVFAVRLSEGKPDVFLAMRTPLLDQLNKKNQRDDRTKGGRLEGYAVVSLVREITIDGTDMPWPLDTFFGESEFDAGRGVTLYGEFEFPESAPVSQILSLAGSEDNTLGVRVFLGISAAEGSLGTSAGAGGAVGAGLTVTASASVRPDWLSPLGVHLEGELFFEFTIQDSLSARSSESSSPHDASWGVSVGLTLGATDSDGDAAAFTGTLGLESDIDEVIKEGPKSAFEEPDLVATMELDGMIEFGLLRIGNPSLIFATPIAKGERDTTSFAVSGTFGFGPPDDGETLLEGLPPLGFGSGDGDLEAIGRITTRAAWIKLTPEELPTPATNATEGGQSTPSTSPEIEDARKRVDAARDAVQAAEDLYHSMADTLEQEEDAKDAAADSLAHYERLAREQEQESGSSAQVDKWRSVLLQHVSGVEYIRGLTQAAYDGWRHKEQELEARQAELDRLRNDREPAEGAGSRTSPTESNAEGESPGATTIDPDGACKGGYIVGGRCVTLTVSLSIANGAIGDLIALLVQTIIGGIL